MYKETNKQRTGEKPHFTSTVEMVSFYDGSISGALTKAASYIRNNGIDDSEDVGPINVNYDADSDLFIVCFQSKCRPGFNIEGRRINA